MKKIIFMLVIYTFVSNYGGEAFAQEKSILKKQCDLTTIKDISQLVSKRALIMKQVALIKYNQSAKPIIYRDSQEIRILKSSFDKANFYNIDPVKYATFIQLQMDLSKYIQGYWISKWNKNKIPNNLPKDQDLTEIREKIMSINKQIITTTNKINKSCSLSVQDVNRYFQQELVNIEGVPTNIDYIKMLAQSYVNIFK